MPELTKRERMKMDRTTMPMPNALVRAEDLDERERRLDERERSLRASERQMRARATRLAPSAHAKIGRNEPCPCGSGLKYKRCHGT